jgi:chromosome segregation ATPase
LDKANLRYRDLVKGIGLAKGRTEDHMIEVLHFAAQAAYSQLDDLMQEIQSARCEVDRQLHLNERRAQWNAESLARQLKHSSKSLGEHHRDLLIERARADVLERRREEWEHERAGLLGQLEASQNALAKMDDSVHSAEDMATRAKADAERFERSLTEVRGELVEAHARLERTEADLTDLASRRELLKKDLKVVREYLAERESEASRLRDSLDSAVKSSELLRRERDTFKQTLIGLRGSSTYLLGKAVRDAARSPRGLVRLIPEVRKTRRVGKDSRGGQ